MPDPALDATITRIARRTGRTRLEVLAVMGDRLQRLQVSSDDTHEVAQRAAALSNVTAAIDAEIERGL